jgi:hypothetical protein
MRILKGSVTSTNSVPPPSLVQDSPYYLMSRRLQQHLYPPPPYAAPEPYTGPTAAEMWPNLAKLAEEEAPAPEPSSFQQAIEASEVNE